MAPFRRRTRDPRAEAIRMAFRSVATGIDAAQRVLLKAVPTPRDPGTPLAVAIGDFLDAIARAEAGMPAWRTEATERPWRACAEAIAVARERAHTLRDDPATLSFEQLNARLGEVTSPLDVFADVGSELPR